MGKKIFGYWKEFLVIALSILIIRILFFQTHPQSRIIPHQSAAQIKEKAEEVSEYLENKSDDYQILPILKTNQGLVSGYQKKFGIEEGTEKALREEKPYFWEISWLKGSDFVFRGGERQMEELKDFVGRLNLRYDLYGNLIGLNYGFPDTSKTEPVSLSDAQIIAGDFARKFMNYINFSSLELRGKAEDESGPENIKIGEEGSGDKKPPKNRIDYTFTASYADPDNHLEKKVSISVTGKKVSLVKLSDYDMQLHPQDDNDNIHSIVNALLIIGIIILIIILLFRRFRAFEVGFKQSFKIAVITALFVGIEIIISVYGDLSFNFVLAIIFGPLFSGLGVLIVWTITESLGREKWKSKFTSVDLMLKGYFGDSKIGSAIIKGLSLGFGLNALLLLLYLVFDRTIGISVISNSSDYISHSMGAVKLFFGAYASNIYAFLVLIVFLTTFLKDKLKDYYIIPAVGIIMGLIDTGFVSPDFADIIIQSLLGMILVWFFLRNDILASFTGLASSYFIFRAEPMLLLNSHLQEQSVIFTIALFVIIILWAIYAIATKDKVLDYASLTPAYVARITERERLKRELEIAEEVQLSFLPDKTPEREEVSIYARCIPASEVGGDYYDYIDFGKNSIGVVIGDVSGKGIQASFYMTLVKGFVKAVAKQTTSPSEILNRVNQLFCENVEKGNFITMVLAKLNLQEKKLVFSRAGHNPVFIKRKEEGKVFIYQPKGFALGMENTGHFPRFIEEEDINLNSGDIVIFYTDGFTEAMNGKREEFGEKRFIKLIEEAEFRDVKELSDYLYKEVKSFIGKAPQHDDMTLVIIKMN